MASAVFPLGRLILAASQTKAREAAQAISLAFWRRKRQVSIFSERLAFALLISSAVRITAVLSLLRALSSLDCCVGVSTSFSLSSSPLPTTTMLEGAVTE